MRRHALEAKRPQIQLVLENFGHPGRVVFGRMVVKGNWGAASAADELHTADAAIWGFLLLHSLDS